MIPVTSFEGRKVAVFGLGASGLASASALFAGGADVVGWDDSEARIAHATQAGIPTADLREVDWSRVAALVLAPGVPLTHPAPHWSAALALAGTPVGWAKRSVPTRLSFSITSTAWARRTRQRHLTRQLGRAFAHPTVQF